MSRALAWLRARSTAQLVVLASGFAGVVFFLRIVLDVDPTLEVVLLMLGLSTAWVANVAAALLLGLGAIRKVRGLPIAEEDRRLAVLLVGLLGSGWLVAGLALLFVAVTDAPMLLVVAGLAAIVLAARRHRRPPATLLVTALLLAGVIAGFQIPREIGTYSLSWKTSEARWNWNTNGGHNCTGLDLGDRPAAIAPYRPDYVFEPQLQGTLGELVGERIGQGQPPPPYVEGRARIHVGGQLDYGGLACYLPLHKSLDVTATISTNTLFHRNFGDGSLDCSASHQITFDVHVTATGVVACRDLATEAAQHIADQLHAHARSVCGY
jgi:hypothetical protein